MAKMLFGLSMDYHVFILSRVREAFDRGMRTEDAVAHGIKATAGVVTSAAIVMVAVFSIFATLSALEFKQMGVGLAAAILIDATIIRAVLLPATMKLLGDWNWYLPRSLRWLPRVATEPAAEGARAQTTRRPIGRRPPRTGGRQPLLPPDGQTTQATESARRRRARRALRLGSPALSAPSAAPDRLHRLCPAHRPVAREGEGI